MRSVFIGSGSLRPDQVSNRFPRVQETQVTVSQEQRRNGDQRSVGRSIVGVRRTPTAVSFRGLVAFVVKTPFASVSSLLLRKYVRSSYAAGCTVTLYPNASSCLTCRRTVRSRSRRAGKARHVAPGLRHEADGADSINARNRVQRRQHRLERGDAPINFRRQPLERLVEVIDLGEDLFQQKRMHRPDAPHQRPLQPGRRGPGDRSCPTRAPRPSRGRSPP